ncbi:DNA-binding response regulator [Clostridium thermosuccinogenes]|uniref:Stage 0 sporulation protein A homolog n=1 Tax=Clostridium thermosuccinogenes TaxID=84032 RepID=A0A2K2FET5_9CLOT|nr:LytTR family DNA-binding domain-containing protein [Pseudoclostridium thermosuccinogenes]AUS95319.1 DNA-binding response regulator [Pseudoclostridium thermosuccinogenes]PNT97284.1 DNA-binding response regulator [Pseudoclostridium thermosuccinogenes]PNT99261.1 DNA-binding response regulator [Pseudoclostridium thermosuccinogenes]
MLHIAICDDNIDELCHIIQLINLYRSSKHLNLEYAVFPNGFDLISALEKGKRFDIYCLDIIMPGFTGIDVAKEIRAYDKTAPILFFTSSPEFALESYSVKAINYVLKPISKEKLFFTFDDMLEHIKVKKDEDAIVVKSNEGIQKILISNLIFAEVIGRNVLYHLLSGKVIKCTESFSHVCDNLMKYGCFIKTHRSYIVNMQYVDTIEEHQVILQSLSSVPVAQGKAREIKQQYLAYQMEGE